MEMRYLKTCQTILKFDWGSVRFKWGQKRINNARKIVCFHAYSTVYTYGRSDRIYTLFLATTLLSGISSLWF